MDFYGEFATLIGVLLLGHRIEMRSVVGALRGLPLTPAVKAVFMSASTVIVAIDQGRCGRERFWAPEGGCA